MRHFASPVLFTFSYRSQGPGVLTTSVDRHSQTRTTVYAAVRLSYFGVFLVVNALGGLLSSPPSLPGVAGPTYADAPLASTLDVTRIVRCTFFQAFHVAGCGCHVHYRTASSQKSHTITPTAIRVVNLETSQYRLRDTVRRFCC